VKAGARPATISPVDVSRAEVVTVIDRLLAGDLSREQASEWAAERHVEVSPDRLVEDALDVLVLIDACHTPGRADYLYDYREVTEAREALLR